MQYVHPDFELVSCVFTRLEEFLMALCEHKFLSKSDYGQLVWFQSSWGLVFVLCAANNVVNNLGPKVQLELIFGLKFLWTNILKVTCRRKGLLFRFQSLLLDLLVFSVESPATAAKASAAATGTDSGKAAGKAAKAAKGGASGKSAVKAPDRAVDVSRLDMRVGRIVSAQMVSRGCSCIKKIVAANQIPLHSLLCIGSA